MKNKKNWSVIMQGTDERRSNMRGPVLLGIIAGLHVVAIAGFLVIQGCATKPTMVEPPPTPVMPPRADVDVPPIEALPGPTFQPPVAVEYAPSSLDAASVQTYTVVSGDSLSKIAKRHGVTVREITELNGIKDPGKIRIGQKLKLPSYASLDESAPAHAAKAKPAKATAQKKAATSAAADAGEYVVQSGDSLSKIAARHGVKARDLAEANGIKDLNRIRVGQKLKIPGGAAKTAASSTKSATPAVKPVVESATPVSVTPVEVPPAADTTVAIEASPAAQNAPAQLLDPTQIPFEYTLRPGETIQDVAQNFGVLEQDILNLNNLTDGSGVSGGTKLKIPVSAP